MSQFSTTFLLLLSHCFATTKHCRTVLCAEGVSVTVQLRFVYRGSHCQCAAAFCVQRESVLLCSCVLCTVGSLSLCSCVLCTVGVTVTVQLRFVYRGSHCHCAAAFCVQKESLSLCSCVLCYGDNRRLKMGV